VRKEHFSFIETSEDPVLTIAANAILKLAHLCLFSTMIFMMSGAARQQAEPNDEERAGVSRLEEKKKSVEAEIQRLREEKDRIDSQRATPAAAGTENSRLQQQDEKIAALKADLAERAKYLESLQKSLPPSAGPAGDTADAALPAQLSQLRGTIEINKRELDALELQIQAAAEKAATIRGEQDKRKVEIARLQNEERGKRAEIEKLKKKRESLEDSAVRGIPDGDTKKTKTVGVQLANNHLIPLGTEYYEVKESGYIQREGRKVSAAKLCRKEGVQGDDVATVGTDQGALAKLLGKIDPKTERVMLYVNPNSFEIMRKTIEIISRKGIEVGWWPDPDESPCYVVTADTEGSQLPSQQGQVPP
jgi:peptidoglycan hydrolase CwlO-like protein